MQFHVTLLCLLKHADVLLLLVFHSCGLPAAVGCWAPMPSPILRFGDLLFHHLKKVAITRTVPPIVTFFNSIINFICWTLFFFLFFIFSFFFPQSLKLHVKTKKYMQYLNSSAILYTSSQLPRCSASKNSLVS